MKCGRCGRETKGELMNNGDLFCLDCAAIHNDRQQARNRELLGLDEEVAKVPDPEPLSDTRKGLIF